MKKGFILGMVTGIAIAGMSLVLANSEIQAILNDQIKITLNGQIQEFRDETTNELQYPITYHDRTYLPLRNVATLAGLDVNYDSDTNTALLNQKEKDFNTIFRDIREYQNHTGNYHSIQLLTLDGKKIYTCYLEKNQPHLEIYDENGELLYSGNGDLGESDIYTDEGGKLYYYEYNLINGKKPNKNQYIKYYLKYKNGNIISYKEEIVEDTEKDTETNTEAPKETTKETITRYVEEYNKQNPDYMISEVYWSYTDYIKFLKDGIIIDVYYNNGKIKVVVDENTYIDTQDGIRKDLVKWKATNYKEFIYNLAKVGNKNLSKEAVDNIYKDLEDKKYGSKILSNNIEIDGITFNYYNQIDFFHTEIEFDFN